jgi:hypothetical protein
MQTPFADLLSLLFSSRRLENDANHTAYEAERKNKSLTDKMHPATQQALGLILGTQGQKAMHGR